ncbi:hypothetical protein [Cupriavidus pinatubonensis]|uniref:hypothetical protein n=1 Tax=Cupriavidus pinatubonensis TaxID=248026 RepID=UPI002159F8FF|nr:hypothetical protein [Cupriavidus pinatubonensis]
MLVALMRWGDRWATVKGKATVDLVEDATGKPIETMAVRSAEGQPLSFREVRFTAGPGATSTTKEVIVNRNARVLPD